MTQFCIIFTVYTITMDLKYNRMGSKCRGSALMEDVSPKYGINRLGITAIILYRAPPFSGAQRSLDKLT